MISLSVMVMTVCLRRSVNNLHVSLIVRCVCMRSVSVMVMTACLHRSVNNHHMSLIVRCVCARSLSVMVMTACLHRSGTQTWSVKKGDRKRTTSCANSLLRPLTPSMPG